MKKEPTPDLGPIPKHSFTVPDFCYEMLAQAKRIQSIIDKLEDGKIIIYGAGKHTHKLYAATDISTKNVIAIVDKEAKTFHEMKVHRPQKELLEKADFIIISVFEARDAIASYLDSIGLSGKTVSLYSASDKMPFYTFESDSERQDIYDLDLNVADVYHDQKIGIAGYIGTIFEHIDDASEFFPLFSLFPKETDFLQSTAMYTNEDMPRKLGIVVQGPILYKNDFTYQTLKLYKDTLCNTVIVLSTWENELNNSKFGKFYDLGIEIILNKEPEENIQPAFRFTNHMLFSISEGIKHLASFGVEHVLRTRTDQRITNLTAFKYLTIQQERFSTIDSPRITILPSYDIGWVPDIFMYGSLTEMEKYWTYTPISEHEKKKFLAPERLFPARYLRMTFDSYEEWEKTLLERFIIADPSVIKFFWYKYGYLDGSQHLIGETYLQNMNKHKLKFI